MIDIEEALQKIEAEKKQQDVKRRRNVEEFNYRVKNITYSHHSFNSRVPSYGSVLKRSRSFFIVYQ
jgi:hypothetical protein